MRRGLSIGISNVKMSFWMSRGKVMHLLLKTTKLTFLGGRCGNKDLQNFVEIDLVTGKCSEIKLKTNNIKGGRKPGLWFRNNTLFCFSEFDGSYLKDFIYIDLT